MLSASIPSSAMISAAAAAAAAQQFFATGNGYVYPSAYNSSCSVFSVGGGGVYEYDPMSQQQQPHPGLALQQHQHQQPYGADSPADQASTGHPGVCRYPATHPEIDERYALTSSACGYLDAVGGNPHANGGTWNSERPTMSSSLTSGSSSSSLSDPPTPCGQTPVDANAGQDCVGRYAPVTIKPQPASPTTDNFGQQNNSSPVVSSPFVYRHVVSGTPSPRSVALQTRHLIAGGASNGTSNSLLSSCAAAATIASRLPQSSTSSYGGMLDHSATINGPPTCSNNNNNSSGSSNASIAVGGGLQSQQPPTESGKR